MIITKEELKHGLTFEDLFKDYKGGSFDTKISLPDERVGNEKW